MSASMVRTEARRVMVVDDYLDALMGAAQLLRALGYEVRGALDGLKALSCAAEFRPDVALIDLSLPGLDGFAVARRLRALPATRDTLLIAMTGWATKEHERRAHDAGFDLHLVKPVSVDVLTSALEGARC
jgi:two-component system CheB/CheR fusion protein